MSGKGATLDGLVHDYAEIHAPHTTKAIPCSCPFDSVYDLSGTAWRVCSRYGCQTLSPAKFDARWSACKKSRPWMSL
jgi:hypothetical protein